MNLQNYFQEFANKQRQNGVSEDDLLMTYKIATDTSIAQTINELSKSKTFDLSKYKFDLSNPQAKVDLDFIKKQGSVVINEKDETLLDVFSRNFIDFLKKVSLEYH